MAYQSIDGTRADSNSQAKLEAIRLPNLAGKRFLDIGCNAGFFCREAIRQGASRVVGIEKNPTLSGKAQENAPESIILNQSWDILPNEEFDVIIMLSALHYESRPKNLMKRIYDRLAPNGLFILEIGSIKSNEYFYFPSVRTVGTVHYQSEQLLIDHTLEDFAVRGVGRSVQQPGDKTTRRVYHCTKRQPTYLLVSGKSGSGKTNILFSMRKMGAVTFSTDEYILMHHANRDGIDDTVLLEYFSTLKNHESIGVWIDGIIDINLAKSLAKLIFNGMPKESALVMAEGYVFCNNMILDEVIRLIGAAGFRAWTSTRAV